MLWYLYHALCLAHWQGPARDAVDGRYALAALASSGLELPGRPVTAQQLTEVQTGRQVLWPAAYTTPSPTLGVCPARMTSQPSIVPGISPGFSFT